MPYRILVSDIIEVDTVEELEAALRVVQRLSRRGEHEASGTEPEGASGTEEERAARCFRRLKPNQANFLRLLKTRLGGVALDDAPSLLGLASNLSLSGVVSVTIRCLKREGVDPERVFVTRRAGTGARRKITYCAGPLLVQLSLPEPETLHVEAGSMWLSTQQQQRVLS